jgi:hypothetical protein
MDGTGASEGGGRGVAVGAGGCGGEVVAGASVKVLVEAVAHPARNNTDKTTGKPRWGTCTRLIGFLLFNHPVCLADFPRCLYRINSIQLSRGVKIANPAKRRAKPQMDIDQHIRVILNFSLFLSSKS